MSPRAAWRLEGLGFSEVYDYVPGKVDWFAAGLPKEGKLAEVPTVGEAARRDVPTCSPEEKLGEARRRTDAAALDRCVVVNEERVVLGLLREKELGSDPEAAVEKAMRLGPATFRPDEPVEKVGRRMRDRGVSAVLVTTSDGKLIGVLYRGDADRLTPERSSSS
jgi:CBS domain-containing protein